MVLDLEAKESVTEWARARVREWKSVEKGKREREEGGTSTENVSESV